MTRVARRQRSRRLLTAVVLLAVVGVGAWVLAPRREEVLDALAALDPVLVVVSGVATLAGVVLTAEVWRSWLFALGRTMPAWTAHRLFYVTQSAKYLPGGLWPVAAQAAVSRRFDVPVAAMVTASSLFMLTHVVTGAAVGLALLGATSNLAVAATSQVLSLAGLALLTPPGVRLAMAAARRLRLPVHLPVPGWAAVGRAMGLMLLAWACYGVALLCLARAAGVAGVGLLTSTGIFATAWTVGFLALAVPAGVGVRETIVVGALVAGGGESAAIAVAVVSRALFTLADLALALASVGVVSNFPLAGPNEAHPDEMAAGAGGTANAQGLSPTTPPGSVES